MAALWQGLERTAKFRPILNFLHVGQSFDVSIFQVLLQTFKSEFSLILELFQFRSYPFVLLMPCRWLCLVSNRLCINFLHEVKQKNFMMSLRVSIVKISKQALPSEQSSLYLILCHTHISKGRNLPIISCMCCRQSYTLFYFRVLNHGKQNCLLQTIVSSRFLPSAHFYISFQENKYNAVYISGPKHSKTFLAMGEKN